MADIYPLEVLAGMLNNHVVHLRRVAAECARGEKEEYKGYKFFGTPGKAWYAYPADQEINFHSHVQGPGGRNDS